MRSKPFGLVLILVFAMVPVLATPVASAQEEGDRSAVCHQGVAFVPELEGHEILETGAFPCHDVDLLSFFTNDEIGGGLDTGTGRGSDVWGWRDPVDGREYVLAGLEVGTSFIDITDPKNPVYLAHLPTASTENLIWRDIKVHADHAFIVAESVNHGMQVFDLTRLRDIDPADAPVTVDADAHYDRFSNAHNVAVNEDAGVAYAVGTTGDLQGAIQVIVDPPSSAAGTYFAAGASSGPAPSEDGFDGNIVLVNDGSDNPTEGCQPLIDFPADAIALIDRGNCPFVQKINNAQDAGAGAVIVANNAPGAPFNMGGDDPDITITSVMVSLDDGNTIKAGLPATGTVLGDPEAGNPCRTGLHIVDINDPLDPTFAGCWEDSGVHDAHCLTYDGPDARFSGRDICVVSTGNNQDQSIAVVDVSDPAEPVTLSDFVSYPNSAFSHQGWVLDGHRYYLHNSESTSRTPQVVEVFDLADLTDPQHIGAYETPAQSTHHNLYQKGRYVHQSNYSSGLRVFDTRNVGDGELEEVAFFDVYPPDDDPGFGIGTWSNYPWFSNNVVAVHGYQGLWIVQPRLGFPNQARIDLLGENEPDGGDPDGSGSARVSWDQSGQVCFDIRVRNIAPVTAAHIHVGLAGVNGPIVVDFDVANQGLQGCVQADPAIVDEIRRDAERFYVNVHNADFPGGALRGQLG